MVSVSLVEWDITVQGVCDLAGNVREWCRDHWRIYKPGGPQYDPVGQPGDEGDDRCFAIRGGSFATLPESARVTWRSDFPGYEYKMKEDMTSDDLGFRVVLEVLLRSPDPATDAASTVAVETRP